MLCKINGKFYKINRWLPILLITAPFFKKRKVKIEAEEVEQGPSKEFIRAITTIIGLFIWMLLAWAIGQHSWFLGFIALTSFAFACLISISKGIIYLIKTTYSFAKRVFLGIIRFVKKIWKFKITFYRVNGRWL